MDYKDDGKTLRGLNAGADDLGDIVALTYEANKPTCSQNHDNRPIAMDLRDRPFCWSDYVWAILGSNQ
jgi:hypothetical protein